MKLQGFLLDEVVSASVGHALRRKGFAVKSAAQVGLGSAVDDDLTVWADDRGFAVVTHDRGFSRRRRADPIGRHIELRCSETMATDALIRHLDQVLQMCAREHVVVVVTTRDVSTADR